MKVSGRLRGILNKNHIKSIYNKAGLNVKYKFVNCGENF